MIETIRIDDLTVLRAASAVATRRPVLFVHGYFVDGTIWNDWLEFFAARGVDAYAVNLSGRSGSRPQADLGRLSIDDFVNDAATVASRVGAAAVVGHSMGGLIAQRLAERGAVDAAVLVAPAPPRGITVLSPRLAMAQLKYLPAILRSRPVYPGREDLRALVLNRVPAHQQEALLENMLPDSGRAGRDMSITGVPVDRHRVRCPLLVIGAEDDQFIPHHIVSRIAERYHAPLITVEHHGHMVIVEPNWQQVAETVERWIRERT
ncbi:MAG TPA: alpha/beta hydrolase [Gemmatimonadaceae bacterium]